ncbi:MAG: DNA mismatch repair endonuclease MutL [Bacteroidia bacterium]|nr:DNA mismatch repair endonuclease MutL [Bacteroidia bacterium]
MPDIIKLLPDSVANQIAAGEVIQRPASVVKELMENAVDAGAGKISVMIKDSGKTLIQVIDDGWGMSETDARLSFERHATSKISSASDLFAISTKGFRGEALASVAAVSMVELRTRKKGTETGTLIVISGSKVEAQEPCSCPEGSSFSVKNLFYNIPARRKFLKSDMTEFRHIINEFQKVVMSHPEIRFSLHHNESEIYNLTTGNFRQRITAVFGKQINHDLINLETDTSLISIKGFIGKPESARRTYGEQFFFINRRFMKHPYFHKAVSEAYQNILPAEAIPTYFIFLEADPASIDINIHPTKTEIKFEDERSIWQILMASVREALGRFNIVPSLDFENESLIEIPVRKSGDSMPQPPVIEINPGYNPFDSDEQASHKTGLIEKFERENTANWEKLYSALEKGEELPETTAGINETGRKFFQIRNKYIVCPVKSGLMLIDQKRAHERILFEKFLECLSKNRSISQTELFPVSAELNPADILVLKEIGDDLKILGFNIGFPGKNRIIVKGLPSGSDSSDPVGMLGILIEEFRNARSDLAAGAREKLAAAMAAASAIPYGKSLTQSEMENLFDSLFACSAPNYSPKGKSIVIIITLEDIDKKFK